MDEKAAAERKTVDMHDLYMAMNRYVQDNRSNRIIERRWLAAYLEATITMIATLKMNGAESLPEEHRSAIRDFRLGEITSAKLHLQREADALDQEARKIQQSKPKAA
jgi:hypothetical protein